MYYFIIMLILLFVDIIMAFPTQLKNENSSIKHIYDQISFQLESLII